MLELCTQTEYFQKRYGDKEALRKLKECGFEAVDFCLAHQRLDAFPANLPLAEYEAYFEDLGRFAEDIKLKVNQTHPPFPFAIGDDNDENRFVLQERCIRATGRLGAKYAVIHPPLIGDSRYGKNKEENRETLLRFCDRILPTLKEYGVVACLENIFIIRNGRIYPSEMGLPAAISDILDELNPEYFAACVDVGHASLTGLDPAAVISFLGNKVRTLHLHDNNGITDLHLALYAGVLDWTDIARALHDTGFKGALSLESDHTYEWWEILGDKPEFTAKLLVRSVEKLREEIRSFDEK